MRNMNKPPKYVFVECFSDVTWLGGARRGTELGVGTEREVKYIRMDDHEKEVRLLKQSLSEAQKNPPIV